MFVNDIYHFLDGVLQLVQILKLFRKFILI